MQAMDPPQGAESRHRMQPQPGENSLPQRRQSYPRSGRPKAWWAKLIFPVLGAVSLGWFLIRVGPKPSRAAYPCQRLALPLAAGFLAWLMAVGLWIAARRAAIRAWAQSRPGRALAWLGVALAALAAVLQPVIGTRLQAFGPEPHAPMGVGRGLNAGRVVWVHAPGATDWPAPSRSKAGTQTRIRIPRWWIK